MKELSIEEKAKRYDKAMERARYWEKNPTVWSSDDICQKLFPELKESEDERIRKALIDGFKRYDDGALFNGCLVRDIVAWLEKQGEQKPTDKVEQKFMVGDWCIDKEDGTVFQILKVLDNTYTYKTNEGREYKGTTHYSLENDSRLWTIQDAKDGDVLSYRDGQWCFIYKGIVTEDTFKYYALLSEKGITVNDAAFSLLSSCITPATKEQRDQLEKAITEAGYEWNAEKKELKKIEQIPVDLPNGEDYGIDGLYAAVDILQKTLGEVDGYQSDDGILTHKCAISAVKELSKQKPAWSEEDEAMITLLHNIIDHHYSLDIIKKEEQLKLKDWLKSLKDRYTWKPSDEQMKALEHFVRSVGESGYASPHDNNTKLLYSLLADLKKLREE